MVLYLAANGGEVQQVDMQRALELSDSQTTRNVKLLSKWINKGHHTLPDKPGLGLVESHIYQSDYRHRVVRLTPAGKRFVNEINRIIG